jgi:hypothetical protein
VLCDKLSLEGFSAISGRFKRGAGKSGHSSQHRNQAMTLIGKIFTVLILVMSLVFMSFAVMVFATHKNWKEVATSATPAKGTGQIGLKQQLEQAFIAKRSLEVELENLKGQLAEHQAARRQALAVLQTQVQQALADLTKTQDELAKLQTDHTAAIQKLAVAEANLEKTIVDNTALRSDILTIQKDRDDKYARVVALSDNVNQAQTKLAQLDERKAQLIQQVAYQKMVLEQHNIDVNGPLPTSLERPVDGVVTAVGDKEKNLIEMSIGLDDGIRENQILQVYRENKYLGRVIVRKVTANRSVGEIDPKFQQGPIRKGDRVASKIT